MLNRPRLIVGLVVVLMTVGPLSARGADMSLTIKAFGDRRSDLPATPYDDQHSLFANSNPTGTSAPGLLHVVGHANPPGVAVTITATDPQGATITQALKSATTYSGGRGPGDFEVELNVTQLGIHFAGPGGSCGALPVPPSCDPNDPDPEHWGPSRITVAGSLAGSSGPPVIDYVTKYAGTPRDLYSPVLQRDGYGLPRGLIWPPCRMVHNYYLIEISGIHPKVRGALSCDQPYVVDDANKRVGGRVSGQATDVSNDYGVASEIANITITVSFGDPTDPVNVLLSLSSTYRAGSLGMWDTRIWADDFPPSNQQYLVTVIVTDAWGNMHDESGIFTSLPF